MTIFSADYVYMSIRISTIFRKVSSAKTNVNKRREIIRIIIPPSVTSRPPMSLLTSATLTRSFIPGKTFVTLPSNQCPLGSFSFTTSTRSPTARFHCGLNHFCLCCKIGKYSCNQRVQNLSLRICDCFQHFLLYKSALSKFP